VRDAPAVRLVPAADSSPASADPSAQLGDRPEAGRLASLAPAVQPLLVPAPEAARLCGVSEATWYRLKAAGKTPNPIRLGGKVLYRLEDLKLWLVLGCPDRKTFEAHKSAGGRPR
jgi:predicted DNA-binding transcriptional regulator AlpA